MLKFCFFVLSPIIVFSLYSRKFANPNKLIFLFGKKGSGKSTYMVKLMLRDIKKGWTIYTNMPDVNIPHVRIFDANDLKDKRPAEHSAVYIDEVGLLWDNRDFKNFDAGFTEFFKLQRKYKCKLVINSQAFDVDKKIRDLTDSMLLQSNIGNVIGVTRPIKRKITLTEPDSKADSRIADSLKFAPIWEWKFSWLPRYFKYFESFRAPYREEVAFREVGVPAELQTASVKSAFNILKNARSEARDSASPRLESARVAEQESERF